MTQLFILCVKRLLAQRLPSTCVIARKIIGIVGAWILLLPSMEKADARAAEFVFGIDTVCSVKNGQTCVKLGSPWTAMALKQALPGYKIEYSVECEGPCFLVQSEFGILEILQDSGKVSFLRSLSGSVDFLGNAIGSKLRNAVGATAQCNAGLNLVCWHDKGLRYIVGGCEIGIQNSTKVLIPDCAVIDGIELGSLGVMKGHSGQPTHSRYAAPYDKFPATQVYAGATKMPDFKGRDRRFSDYRTRISEGLQKQQKANFAGGYNLVPIRQTGGVIFTVVDSATGTILWSGAPSVGTYYSYAFRQGSRLLVMQWSNGEQCFIQHYEWSGVTMLETGGLIDRSVDGDGFCQHALSGSED